MRRLRGARERHGGEVLHHARLAVDGAEVTTIEGLAAERRQLHPMQEAFRENHGLQCGFCTPGMIMSAVDIVRRKGNELDEKTIRHELDGNLCRCTGYHNIVKAIAAGAAPWDRAGKGREVERSGEIIPGRRTP